MQDTEGRADGSSRRNRRIASLAIRGTKQRQVWGSLGPQPSSFGFTKLLLSFIGSGNHFKEDSDGCSGHLGPSPGSGPRISLGNANLGFSRQPGSWGVGPQHLGGFQGQA